MSKPPTFIECSVCGREFGSKSIRIHEPQCLSKLRRTEIKDSEVNKNVKPGNKKRNKVSPPGNNPQGSSSQPFYGGVGMTTTSKKINLPKIHTNSIIYPSSKLVRPNTATLDKPRILNPDFSYYDMSLTRIDFNNVVPASSSAHKGMDDNHNTSEAIDTSANRSPFILPAVNTAPATPSNSATAHHTYASSISTNGSKRSQLSQRGPTTKVPVSGIMEMTRVSDAWLGNPLSPSPTGSHHNLKSYQVGAGAAGGGGGGLSVLGNPDFGVPPYSREADLVTRPPQSSSFPPPTSEPCGDVPDTQILNSLHFTPIEIDVRHEIVPRTETQPDEEPFLTPSGSFTCILTAKQEPPSEKERVIQPPSPQKTSRFHENVIIVKYGGDDGCQEESLQDEQKPPQPQQTGGGFPEVPKDRVEKGTSTVTQIQVGKIEDKAVKIDSDISVLYKSPVHESGSGVSLTCLNGRYTPPSSSGMVTKKDSSVLQEFASGCVKSEVTVEVQRCESVDQFVAEKLSREMKDKGEDDGFMEFAYSKVPSNSLNESEASEQSSKTNMMATEEEAASSETNKNPPIASNSAFKLLTKAANFINELVRATDPAHGTPQADAQESRGNRDLQEEGRSTSEESSEVSAETSVEESTTDEGSDEAASNKKSSTKSIEFRLELNVEYQPVEQADSRDSIESEIELSPVTATRFELDNILQITGSGTETDDEDSSKIDAKDLTLKNSVSSRILHRKKTQTWKSNTAIQDPDSKESLMPLEIITVKAPAAQIYTGEPALEESTRVPDIPENKPVQDIPENKPVPEMSENKAVTKIPENKPVPEVPDNKPVPDIPEKTEDEIIAEVLISHLKKDSAPPTELGSERYRVDVDIVEPKRLTKKLVPSNRSNRKHTPTEVVNHVVVEYHDNVSVWEGADISIPIVYDQDSPADLQEPSPPSQVEIIRIDNLPSLSAASPEDEKQLHGFISSVLKLHDIVQAQQKTEASEDQKNPPPSSKYFNRDVYEYLYKNTGSSTSVTAASSTSTVKSTKGPPNETTAPYAWKWKSPTKDSSSHDVQEEKPKLKRRSSKKTKAPIVAPIFDSPSDTSSLASWASSTLQRRQNDLEKKKLSTAKTSGADDNEKDSAAKKTYFRSSTAERLAMPKGSTFLQDTEFSNLVSACNANARRKVNLNRDTGCKSAGTVVVGTQTPRENERLLTPTLLRKKLNSAKQHIAASSTQTPRISKTIPNLDLTKKLPLVPKTKVDSGVQTFEPVKKVEKVVKEKPTTPTKGIKPKIAKTIKELSLKTSSDEESLVLPIKTSATTELDKRAGRSALKSAVTSQPKKPGPVRFLDSSVGNEPTGTIKPATGQQMKVTANEKVKEVNIQDLPGRPVSAVSSATQVKPKGRQGGKLKKVKVSSTKSADHIGLTYRRRSPSPGKKSPRSRSRSKSKEFRGYKLDTFSNVTMIAPSAVPSGVEYVDLNIIVRRKDLEGNYPSIEELVQEVGGDNFFLVLDQDAPLKSRRLQVQDEKRVTYCGKPGDVCQKTFLSFLPQLRCPTPDGKPFFRIPFGKIPVVAP